MRLFLCPRPGFKAANYVGGLIVIARDADAAVRFCETYRGDLGDHLKFTPDGMTDVAGVDLPDGDAVCVWNDWPR